MPLIPSRHRSSLAPIQMYSNTQKRKKDTKDHRVHFFLFLCFFFLHSERFVPTQANMGPSTRERRPVHRLQYECNDGQDNRRATARSKSTSSQRDHVLIGNQRKRLQKEPAHSPTSSPLIAIPEHIEHVGSVHRVGRPSKLSNRTLFILQKWAPANINANERDVQTMHSMYSLPETLRVIRKWFTNFKYRQTKSYEELKPVYAMRKKMKRAMTTATPTQPVADSELAAKDSEPIIPPAPPSLPAQIAMQNEDEPINIDTPDDDDGLAFLTNHLFPDGFSEIDDFLSSFNMT